MIASPFAFWGVCQARVLEAGVGRAYADVPAAAAALRDGDVLRIFPGRYQSCAVLRADGLTVEGVGDATTVVLASAICQGKAILVAAGRGLVVRNLTLAEAKAPEGNGAGLRAERGPVTVEGVRFIDDQDGILTTAASDMVVTVRHSVFEHDGACVHQCAHAIYAGHIAELDVQSSVFGNTQEGHAIKSRAARTKVSGCTITDGRSGTGSYLIEAPNGGAVVITGNRLEKGAHAGNSAAIAIGTEGIDQPSTALLIAGNHFANTSNGRMVFVRNSGTQPAMLTANTLTGHITPLTGPGTVQ